MHETFEVEPIGIVESELSDLGDAPLQADEGAPPAWLSLRDSVAEGLDGLEVGEEILVITWLHRSDRSTLRVHPRGDLSRPERGVFGTRSPDRPNPIGIHRTRILELAPARVKVSELEAVDGTPILDLKAVRNADDSPRPR